MNGKAVQKRRPYQFPGEALAAFLVDWLNGPGSEGFERWRKDMAMRHGVGCGASEPDQKARTRITRLLADLKELRRIDTVLDLSRGDDRLGWNAQEKLIDKINELVCDYRRHDQVVSNRPMLKAGQWVQMREQGRPSGYFWGTVPDLSVPLQELRAVQVVRELDQDGLLERVVTCAACGRWMYARKSNQQSHTTKCRREKYKDQRARGRKQSQFLAEMKERKASGRMQ